MSVNWYDGSSISMLCGSVVAFLCNNFYIFVARFSPFWRDTDSEIRDKIFG